MKLTEEEARMKLNEAGYSGIYIDIGPLGAFITVNDPKRFTARMVKGRTLEDALGGLLDGSLKHG